MSTLRRLVVHADAYNHERAGVSFDKPIPSFWDRDKNRLEYSKPACPLKNYHSPYPVPGFFGVETFNVEPSRVDCYGSW